jgi:hypothetical protein
MRRPDLAIFDCIPVQDGERIVGVLKGTVSHSQGRAIFNARSRRYSVVAADEPLKGSSLLVVPYRLVVRGAGSTNRHE